MMRAETPANARQLAAFLKRGEGAGVEFKRSTGELKQGMQTLCALLNGAGGVLFFGVRSNGTPEGQVVSQARQVRQRSRWPWVMRLGL